MHANCRGKSNIVNPNISTVLVLVGQSSFLVGCPAGVPEIESVCLGFRFITKKAFNIDLVFHQLCKNLHKLMFFIIWLYQLEYAIKT